MIVLSSLGMASAASSSTTSSSEGKRVKLAPLQVIISSGYDLPETSDGNQQQQNTWDVVDYLQRQIVNPHCKGSFWHNLSTVVDYRHKFLVARDKETNNLAGYLVGDYHLDNLPDGEGECVRAEIIIIETCEGWRNRGVGHQLVAEFEKNSKGEYTTVPWITKYMSEANHVLEQSIGFWEKLGYKKAKGDVFVKSLSSGAAQ
jgi:ribosomal protein S18 acetylase RimI-like enzyme